MRDVKRKILRLTCRSDVESVGLQPLLVAYVNHVSLFYWHAAGRVLGIWTLIPVDLI